MLPRMKFRKEDVIVTDVSGRGDKDLDTYLGHRYDEEFRIIRHLIQIHKKLYE